MQESLQGSGPQLPPELIIPGPEAAHQAVTGDISYPATPQVQGEELGREATPESADRALDYTARLLGKDRNTELTVLSDRWSSSVVLEDAGGSIGPPKVYKVFRKANNYDYVENEMEALTTLYDLELAPKPHILIDAGVQYRSTVEGRDRKFKDVPIVRQDLGGELPIIVMDKVEHEPLDSMTDEQLASEFMRVVKAGVDNALSFEDTELVYDPKNQRVIFLDLGGVSRIDSAQIRYVRDGDELIDMYPGKTDEELVPARVASQVLGHFLSGRDIYFGTQEVLETIETGGIESLVEPLIHYFRSIPRKTPPKSSNFWQPPDTHN